VERLNARLALLDVSRAQKTIQIISSLVLKARHTGF